MPFSVFRCLLIACVIDLSIGYYPRHGGKGGTVKDGEFVKREHRDDGNSEMKKMGSYILEMEIIYSD